MARGNWQTRDVIWGKIWTALRAEFPFIDSLLDTQEKRQRAKERAVEALGELRYEFTAIRLLEKLKNAIEAEKFGPLFVDSNGDPVGLADFDEAQGDTRTDVYRVWKMMSDAFKTEVLDLFDEEGNAL
jgi:hypothetical protein